ncbi:MAG: deoxyribonuclease IV [Deltaproteobacteria bacterium]|nr:deoxyribonuclease IV [Deltaproteobacteria bacterium]
MAPLLGAHMSISGGIELAPERGRSVGCDIIQLFTKSSNQWAAKPLGEKEIGAFREKMRRYEIRLAFAHDSYLINLASPDATMHKRSLEAFTHELERAEALGLYALVFHPGSHVGSGEKAAIQKIAESVNKAHQKTKGDSPTGYKVLTCFENAAGQGTNVGHRFEQIAQMLELVEDKKRVGVCFDTQHAFAAGYDLRTEEGYQKTFKEFDKVIGLEKLKCFHLNDSKKELGSRVDRHEELGKGLLGLTPFRCLMNDKRFVQIPMSLETPKDDDCHQDKIALDLLRSFISKK